MGMSLKLIRRYVWLVNTIRQAKQITLEEINKKWMDDRTLRNEDEGKIPERTFHRHRQAIADLFGLDIQCRRNNGNTYYIENEETLNSPSFTSWIFNAFSIDNHLMRNKELAKCIMFEETPGGMEYLPSIIEALIDNRIIRIVYLRFKKAEPMEWEVAPYGIKQSGKRWYLIGKSVAFDRLTVFALDRIEELTITEETFNPDPAHDIKTYFDEVIGVNMDDDYDCEPIVLRVYGQQRDYIETLPLHKTQRLQCRTKEYSDYEFKLRPEYEFQHRILQLGFDAEVLSPQWLRDEIKWQAEEILKRYSTLPNNLQQT